MVNGTSCPNATSRPAIVFPSFLQGKQQLTSSCKLKLFSIPRFALVVQVVVAISGFYVGLYVVFKGLSAIFSSPKKEEVGER